MTNPWQCPICKTVYAPHVDKCDIQHGIVKAYISPMDLLNFDSLKKAAEEHNLTWRKMTEADFKIIEEDNSLVVYIVSEDKVFICTHIGDWVKENVKAGDFYCIEPPREDNE